MKIQLQVTDHIFIVGLLMLIASHAITPNDIDAGNTALALLLYLVGIVSIILLITCWLYRTYKTISRAEFRTKSQVMVLVTESLILFIVLASIVTNIYIIYFGGDSI